MIEQVWESFGVKVKTFKTAIEAACMLLRIDDIVSGIKKKQAPVSGPKQPLTSTGEDVNSEQMIPE